MKANGNKSLTEQLQAPFDESEYEWRIQSSGKTADGKVWARVLCYVTNRAIQNRLDDVFGPMGWQNLYDAGPKGGVICGISVFDADAGKWVTKWDGADNTDIEEVKGGLSDAMKRAAVQWGIGRLLYNLESAFAIIGKDGYYAKTKDNVPFHWLPPKLPDWAVKTRSDKTPLPPTPEDNTPEVKNNTPPPAAKKPAEKSEKKTTPPAAKPATSTGPSAKRDWWNTLAAMAKEMKFELPDTRRKDFQALAAGIANTLSSRLRNKPMGVDALKDNDHPAWMELEKAMKAKPGFVQATMSVMKW